MASARKSLVTLFKQGWNKSGQSENTRPKTSRCSLCGSRDHEQFECKKRDDLGSAAGANGPYRGTAKVRVVPPGITGVQLASNAKKPIPAPGQRWFSPEGVPHLVSHIRGEMAFLRRNGAGKRFVQSRCSFASLKARWFYGGCADG